MVEPGVDSPQLAPTLGTRFTLGSLPLFSFLQIGVEARREGLKTWSLGEGRDHGLARARSLLLAG